MNWYALRFFVMVTVLCFCILAAGWALNLSKSGTEFSVSYPDVSAAVISDLFDNESNTCDINNISAYRHTYRIIEIGPQDEPYQNYDPNYPDEELPKRKKYREHPRIDDNDYKIKPAKSHLLQMEE